MKHLTFSVPAALTALTLLGACGGGSGGSDPVNQSPQTVPTLPVDLTTVAAGMQLFRAAIAHGIGNSEPPGYYYKVPPQPLDFACSGGGGGAYASAEPYAPVTLTNCVTTSAPLVAYNGVVPYATHPNTGGRFTAAGTLLGITLLTSAADNLPFGGSVGVLLDVDMGGRNSEIRFQPGAKYDVKDVGGSGQLTRVGNDVLYTGGYFSQFTYKGRLHVFVQSSALTWVPGVGITSGTLDASFQDASGSRNYTITFSAGGAFHMAGLGNAESGCYQWSSAEFQAALVAVLQP
ncbi:MAG: hypothetical protein AB7L41_16080 [Flavobacteriaceae bacterium]